MSTYEQRLDTVEKDIAVMKHDIIYKLDETNAAITILKGVVGSQGLDIKEMLGQLKVVDVRLERLEVGLEVGLEKVRQTVRGQAEDIKVLKEDVSSLKGDMSSLREEVKTSVDAQNTKLDQILALLSQRPQPQE